MLVVDSVQANLFLYKLLATFGSYAVGFIFYATQFPEKRWPGRFDFVAHSHQMWHIFVLIGALLFYYAVGRDDHTFSALMLPIKNMHARGQPVVISAPNRHDI
jgi:hypothetical protein